jgi:uncharacterized membrane protein YhaH (DUF805 family)
MFETLKKYAVFTGRANRSEFWLFFLTAFVLSIPIAFIGVFVGLVGWVLLGIYTLALAIPNISVSVRRLHDTDAQRVVVSNQLHSFRWFGTSHILLLLGD